MNRSYALMIVLTVLLAFAGAAQAGDSRHSHSRDYGYSSHQRGHDRRHDGWHDRRYRGHGYPTPYRYRRHHHDDDDDDALKVVAGAVVLGSIIYMLSHNNDRREETYAPGPPPESADYWYEFEGNGRCVLVKPSPDGGQYRTPVDPRYCQ